MLKTIIKKVKPIAVRSFQRTANLKNLHGQIDKIAVACPDYRGVKSATREMIPDLAEVPPLYTRVVAKYVAKNILIHQPKIVLVSGYTTGYNLLIEELHQLNPKLRIFVLIHSAFIWLDMYPAENRVFERFINLAKEGVIEKVGFCKQDLAEYFARQGVNSYFVMNRFYPEKHTFKKLNPKKINIGIFGQNQWHRNITNQAVGALMIDGAKLHVNEIAKHFFLDKERIKVYGILPKEEFLKIYQQIDINLYISLTDCFPMTVIESMQYGIPCLVSDTSAVYDFSPQLKKWLMVSAIDGPLKIAQQIKEVVENYPAIQDEIKKYLPVLKEKVEASIAEFLK